jgi:hypothetical protein
MATGCVRAVGQGNGVIAPAAVTQAAPRHALEDPLEEGSSRLRGRIARVVDRDDGEQDVLRLEARIDAAQLPEAADEQSRTDHEHQCERDLRDDKGVAEHGAAGVRVRAPPVEASLGLARSAATGRIPASAPVKAGRRA